MLVQYTLVLIAFQWQYIPLVAERSFVKTYFHSATSGATDASFVAGWVFASLVSCFSRLYIMRCRVYGTRLTAMREQSCAASRRLLSDLSRLSIQATNPWIQKSYRSIDPWCFLLYTTLVQYILKHLGYNIYSPYTIPTHETSEQGKPLNKQTTSMSQRCPLFRGFAIKHTDRCMLCSVVLE